MNTICRLIIVFVLATTIYLIINLFPYKYQENFLVEPYPIRKSRRKHYPRQMHRGWRNPGNRSWWYWGLPRWSRVPTVAYPCNPFWGDCPAYLYNPYSYLYSYKNYY